MRWLGDRAWSQLWHSAGVWCRDKDIWGGTGNNRFMRERFSRSTKPWKYSFCNGGERDYSSITTHWNILKKTVFKFLQKPCSHGQIVIALLFPECLKQQIKQKQQIIFGIDCTTDHQISLCLSTLCFAGQLSRVCFYIRWNWVGHMMCFGQWAICKMPQAEGWSTCALRLADLFFLES